MRPRAINIVTRGRTLVEKNARPPVRQVTPQRAAVGRLLRDVRPAGLKPGSPDLN